MKRPLSTAVLACALAAPLAAVSTKSFDFVQFKDLESAALAGVKVSSEGELSMGLDTAALKTPEKEIWASLVAPDGTAWFTSGNGAALYRIENGAPRKVFGADEVAFACLARGADGTLYIGSLPAGRIYAFDGKDGKLFATLPAPYVWSLAVDAGGHLLAGTGPEGVIYRISPKGEAKIHYDARDGNILSLALAPDGVLYAGSATKGLLYRIKAPGAAEVVWDFKGRELKAMVFAGPRLFVAVNETRARLVGPGAKDGGRTALEFSNLARKLTGRFGGAEVSQEGAELASESSLLKRYESGAAATIEEVTPEARVETVWELAESSILDLEADPRGTLYVATGKGGRVYTVVPRGLAHLVLTVEEAQATTLAMHGGALALVGCANPGAALLVKPAPPAAGKLTTRPLDAGFPSKFGQVRWDGGAGATVTTRSGNTASPDHTWSAWGAPDRAPAGRYLQARVELAGASARLANLKLHYLNQNQTPRVEAVLVGPGKLPEKPADKDKGGPASELKKVTEALSSLAGAKEKQEREEAAAEKAVRMDRPASPVKEVRWSAEDKDGDPLVYRLWFQAAGSRDGFPTGAGSGGEEGWVPLTPREPLETETFAWNTETVPDGRYQLKVVASDERGNPAGEERAGEKLTLPFVVDNTRPSVTVRAAGGSLAIEAADALTPVVRAEVSIDGQEWKPLHPADRLSDQLVERYAYTLPPLAAGPHAVAVRAADGEGNVGASRLIVRVPSK